MARLIRRTTQVILIPYGTLLLEFRDIFFSFASWWMMVVQEKMFAANLLFKERQCSLVSTDMKAFQAISAKCQLSGDFLTIKKMYVSLASWKKHTRK
jgi:hypothetical protein